MPGETRFIFLIHARGKVAGVSHLQKVLTFGVKGDLFLHKRQE
jgi:hypothetical protein